MMQRAPTVQTSVTMMPAQTYPAGYYSRRGNTPRARPLVWAQGVGALWW